MKRADILRVARHGILIAAACMLLEMNVSAAQYARGRLIPEVHLKNGTVLHDVTIVAINTNTVLARWTGGQGTILFSQLPAEMRADLAPVLATPAATSPAPASIAAVVADPSLASAELPTEIRLTNGFVMHKSAVTRWNMDSVLVSYQGGIVLVQFRNISPEQRAIFEARREEAMALQAKADSGAATEQQAAAQTEQAQQATAAQQKEEADRRADEIRNGIAFHYLVKGMTRDEAILAFGKPPEEHGDTFFYTLRGHDKYGNSADRTVTFKDGVIVSWRDQRPDEPNGAVEH